MVLPYGKSIPTHRRFATATPGQMKGRAMCSTPTKSGIICTTLKISDPISCRRSWTKGEIYKHLDDLDTKVTDAVNRQTELLMQSSRDYQVAVESGNLNAVGSIGNLLRMQAQRVVYDTMIYLWRDE